MACVSSKRLLFSRSVFLARQMAVAPGSEEEHPRLAARHSADACDAHVMGGQL